MTAPRDQAPLTVAPLGDADVDGVARFVAELQQDPAQHVVYLGEQPDVVAAELAEAEDWRDRLFVARRGGGVVGALLADVDPEMRRLWWCGPWGTDDAVRRALVDAADAAVGELVDEEEFAVDARNTAVAALAEARGALAATASAVLRLPSLDEVVRPAPDPTETIGLLHDADAAAVAALHDLLFPRTHTPGRRLVDPDDRDRIVRVSRRDGAVTGYVAGEVQADGSGYVDYLGVAPAHRSAGTGRRLVAAALAGFASAGVGSAHLTVLVDNAPARALYGSLGFVEERVAVPWRLGFTTT